MKLVSLVAAAPLLLSVLASNSTDSAEPIPVPHREHHHHGMPILMTELAPEERIWWENYSTETFFNTPLQKRWALYSHLGLYVIPYVFGYPFVLVFWNLKHTLYLPLLFLHAVAVVLLCITFWVFEALTTDLYPHAAFRPMTAILFIGQIVHLVVATVATLYRQLRLAEYLRLEDDDLDGPEHDPEHDQESFRLPLSTLRDSNSGQFSFELDTLGADSHLATSNMSMYPPQELKPLGLLMVLARVPGAEKAASRIGSTAHAATALLNWALFAFFLVYFPTGVATYFRYGLDGTVFNTLAHFIKGGVFFVLGLVTLARYCGAFANKGWAWNHRFVSARKASSRWLRWQPAGLWTMEFVEASLILFYGLTNVFMEHMAAPGGAWTAKDLQHVSIAFIYIGCGLCGVLAERKLDLWRFNRALDNARAVSDSKSVETVTKAMPGFSPNPFPVLTIFWTGYLMSKHDQASELSTAIHVQWGNMFVVACCFRLLTYIYVVLSPPSAKSLTKPLMPMTELVVAFCLLCGGLIFMESCTPVVWSFEYYGYTPMFTLNLSIGFVALLMGWEMIVFLAKDALRR